MKSDQLETYQIQKNQEKALPAGRQAFYITTTLPYVNGAPHIGFALEIIEADVFARFQRALGNSVIFNTGTDEHGVNIYRKALEIGKEPQKYVDEMAQEFRSLKELLNISYTNFIRTTDSDHVAAAQEFWRRCEAAGDIYKQVYKIKYCSGCELEKTDSELNEVGQCLLHPTKEIETLEEENYFFRWSKYQSTLLDLYERQSDFVLPKKRFNEIRSFVKEGLQDFSISRRKEKLPWGVPVPGDDEHVMYVWFDALVNYISTLGWPNNEAVFSEYWPGVQIAGKDNVRQQAGMWQGMLASAGLPFSKQILINGFINVDGQKMSKSLGNVVTPEEMVEKFGIDGTRYLLLSLASLGEDSDLNWERMKEKYNADLANGLGNLVSRVVKLSEKLPERYLPKKEVSFSPEYIRNLEDFETASALMGIWDRVRQANEYMSQEEPWKLVKDNEDHFEEVMKRLLEDLAVIAGELTPLLPETGEKIQIALEKGVTEPLFQRLV